MISREERLRAFLAETLILWRIEGTVEAGDAPVVAVVRAADGTTISIEPAQEGTPFRWLARSNPAGARDKAIRRTRPCTSLVGLLSALRGALGVERGTPMRVAPGRAEE